MVYSLQWYSTGIVNFGIYHEKHFLGRLIIAQRGYIVNVRDDSVRIDRVGKSQIEIAAIGMGCWAYGGGVYWGGQAQPVVNEIISYALEHGVNYFDTAEVYNDGESERSLGIALKGRREKAVIGTKVSTSNIMPATLRKHCEKSLLRLDADYIDIYMLHWPVNKTSIAHFAADSELLDNLPDVAEVFGTLLNLKKEGKIREIGISNHGVGQMKEILAVGTDIAVNELPYNLISRAIEAEILPFCIKNHIGVIGYMAYQQGILTGAYKSFEQLSPSQAHSRHFIMERGREMSRHNEKGAEGEILKLLSVINGVSNQLGVSFATVSLAWAMAKEGISCTLVGSRNIDELKMNIAAAEYVLPKDALDALNAASKPVLNKLGDNPDYYENRNTSRVW